jgi:hypothetical protein
MDRLTSLRLEQLARSAGVEIDDVCEVTIDELAIVAGGSRYRRFARNTPVVAIATEPFQNAPSKSQQFELAIFNAFGERLKSATPTEVSEDVPSSSALRVIDVYPNPFSDRMVVRFSAPARSRVEIALFDVLGRRVWQSPARVASGSVDSVTLIPAMDELASGTYMVSVSTDFERSETKVAVLR